MTLKNKGNRKAQRKRRKERLKQHVPRKPEPHLLIDGNYSHYPVAYCHFHKAFMTLGLVETHRCKKRKCRRYEERWNPHSPS